MCVLACFGCTMLPCYKDADEVVYFKSDGRAPSYDKGINGPQGFSESSNTAGALRTGSINQEEDF